MIRLLVISSISSLLVFSSVARAETRIDEPGIQLALDAQRQVKPPAKKSPATAVLLSVSATLVPLALTPVLVAASGDNAAPELITGALAVTLGPSLGHFYAGEVGHGLLTAGLRGALITGGGLMMLGGLLSSLDCDGDEGPCDHDGGLYIGGAVLLSGAAALAIYDFIDAGFAAKRANKRRTLAVVPLVARSQDKATYGVGLTGTF